MPEVPITTLLAVFAGTALMFAAGDSNQGGVILVRG